MERKNNKEKERKIGKVTKKSQGKEEEKGKRKI